MSGIAVNPCAVKWNTISRTSQLAHSPSQQFVKQGQISIRGSGYDCGPGRSQSDMGFLNMSFEVYNSRRDWTACSIAAADPLHIPQQCAVALCLWTVRG